MAANVVVYPFPIQGHTDQLHAEALRAPLYRQRPPRRLRQQRLQLLSLRQRPPPQQPLATMISIHIRWLRGQVDIAVHAAQGIAADTVCGVSAGATADRASEKGFGRVAAGVDVPDIGRTGSMMMFAMDMAEEIGIPAINFFLHLNLRICALIPALLEIPLPAGRIF